MNLRQFNRISLPAFERTRVTAPLTTAADVDQLNASIFRCFWISGLEQLLFAEAHGFDARQADSKWVDQRFADGVGVVAVTS